VSSFLSALRRPERRELRISVVALALLVVVATVGHAVARGLGASAAILAWTEGARLAVATTGVVVVIALGAGVTLGAAAALTAPWFATFASRAFEVAGALPSLIVAVVLRGIGPSGNLAVFVVVLSVLKSLETAKVVRAAIFALETEEFVLAARAVGSGRTRLFRRHLLPHLVGPALSSAISTAAAVVALDAALAFTGLGSYEPTWGKQIAEAADHHALGVAFFPLAGLVVLLAALHFGADALEGRYRQGRRFV
jgi:peptide/nickel transport system permease protein